MEVGRKRATIGLSDCYCNHTKKINSGNNLLRPYNKFNFDEKNYMFFNCRNGFEVPKISRVEVMKKQDSPFKLIEPGNWFNTANRFTLGPNSGTINPQTCETAINKYSKKRFVGCINRRHASEYQPVYNVSSYRSSTGTVTKPLFWNDYIKYDTYDYPARKFTLGHYSKKTRKKRKEKKQRASSSYFFCCERLNGTILKLIQYVSKFLKDSCVVVHFSNVFFSSEKRKEEKLISVQSIYETFDFTDSELRSFMTGNVRQTDYRKVAKPVATNHATVFPVVQKVQLRTDCTYKHKPAAVIIKTESLKPGGAVFIGKKNIDLKKPVIPFSETNINFQKSAVCIDEKSIDSSKYAGRSFGRDFTEDTEISDGNHNYSSISDNTLVEHKEDNKKTKDVYINNNIEPTHISCNNNEKNVAQFFDIFCDDESQNTPGSLSNTSSYSIFPTYLRQVSNAPQSSTLNDDIGRCVEYFDISSKKDSLINPLLSFQSSIKQDETQNNEKSTVDSRTNLSIHSLINSVNALEEIENSSSDSNEKTISVNKNKQEVIVDESWVEFVRLKGNPNAVA